MARKRRGKKKPLEVNSPLPSLLDTPLFEEPLFEEPLFEEPSSGDEASSSPLPPPLQQQKAKKRKRSHAIFIPWNSLLTAAVPSEGSSSTLPRQYQHQQQQWTASIEETGSQYDDAPSMPWDSFSSAAVARESSSSPLPQEQRNAKKRRNSQQTSVDEEEEEEEESVAVQKGFRGDEGPVRIGDDFSTAAMASTVVVGKVNASPHVVQTDPAVAVAAPPLVLQSNPELEEEALFHESSVRSLTKRNTKLLAELSQVRFKRVVLVKRQNELLERKAKLDAARTEHLSLQQELQESLSRSIERLGRLVKLDDDEEPVEGSPADEEGGASSIGQDGAGKESQGEHIGTAVIIGNTGANAPGRKVAFSTPLVVIALEKALLEEFGIRHRPEKLLNFLPCIDGSGTTNAGSLVEQLMTISIREASASDLEERKMRRLSSTMDGEVSRRVVHRNHRRESLWNTCLDFLQLGSTKRKDQAPIPEQQEYSNDMNIDRFGLPERRYPLHSNVDDQKRSPAEAPSEDSDSSRLDPNFSLCPYELAGVCADEYCPYQHIKKEALVERERLPLPPLRLSPNVYPPANNSQRAEAGPKPREDHQDVEKAAGENAVQQPLEPRTNMREKELEEYPVDRIREAMLPSSLDVDDNSAMAEPYVERVDIIAAMESEVIIVNQKDEVGEAATPTGDEIDEFMLDFVAVPPAEDVSSDEDNAEDEAESDQDNDVVSTFLDDALQSSVTASKLWWSQTVSNDQTSSPGPTSVEAWLDEVAGFRVITPAPQTAFCPPQEPKRSTMILEYRHSAPHTPLDYIQWFGRLVDASRLAVHAGRFDVVQSLQKLATEAANTKARFVHGKEVVEDHGIEFSPNAALAVLGRVVESAFHFDDRPSSCFHAAFGSQISLAIISEAIRYTHDHYDKMGVQQENGAPEQMDSTGLMEWGAVMHLIEACVGSADKVESLAMDLDATNNVVEDLVSGLRNELYRASNLELSGIVAAEKKGHPQSKNPCSFDTLVANVVWALRVCGDRDGVSVSFSVHRVDDGVLKPSWSVVKNFFRRSVGSSVRPAECLRASIMMGYIILGSLEAFVRQVPYGGDQFDSNTSAALNIVDTTIYRILVEWSDLVADVPMLEMLLSPLFAACISTAVFLRHYSKAQHRLESLLGDTRESKRGIPKTKTFSFSKYSELLWSQLVQLRFSLSSSPDTPSGKKKNKYLWDMKPSQIQDCNQLASCIESHQVALHHICLEGDWNLITAMNHRPFVHKNQDLQYVQDWRLSIVRLQQDIMGQEKGEELDLAHCPFVHRQDKANGRMAASDPLRSTLPRSILLAGHSLTSLNLEGCLLSRLPIGFGLCLPALLKLNLSGNRLQVLPYSIREMSCLQELLLERNELRGLPTVLHLLHALKRLLVAHNCLKKVPPSVYTLSKLEELQLHQNFLWTQEGEQEQDKVTAVKLTLWLKKLRSLTYQPQKHLPSESSTP